MADLKRRIVAEFSAKNKAAGQTAAFRRDMDKTGQAMRRMAGFALAAAGLGGGLYALKRIMEGSVKAAAEQEKAESALLAAIGRNISEFKSYAAEMQNLTIYGDELIISQMAYAANLGVTTDKLKEATKAAIGLAAKYRIDLASAMMLVGRASMGQTQMLTRYGIVIEQNLSTEEKFNELLRIGADSFGLAAAEARTASGAYKQFQNAMGDLAETIGEPLMKGLAEMSREVVRNKTEWQDFVKVQTEGCAEILSGFKSIRDIIGVTSRDWSSLGGQFGGGIAGLGGVPGTPPTIPKLSPRERQRMLEMKAATREQEKLAEERAAIHSMQMFEEQKKIIGDINAQLQFKRELMEGTVAGPLADAAEAWEKMLQAEQAYGREFERTMESAGEEWEEVARKREEAMERMADKVREYNWIFTNIIASGLESTMRDYENWKEHLLKMFEELYWAAIRLAYIEPAAQAAAGWMQKGFSWLAGGLAGGFGAGGGGGPAPGVTPSAYAYYTAPQGAQHGGLFRSPTLARIAEAGPELVTPLSQLKNTFGGGMTKIEIRNEGSEKLEISSSEEYLLSDERVIAITIRAMQTDVRYRRNIKQAAR